MWANFSAMPGLLKFLTAHSLAAIVLLVVSVVPHDSFFIDGRHVSYSEWWSSGAGPLASLLGILLPISGYLFLTRHRTARVTYLTTASVALVCPYVAHGHPVSAALGVLMVAFGAWYLYRRPTVVAYFASNNRFERSRG
jgi:hypothetical protein